MSQLATWNKNERSFNLLGGVDLFVVTAETYVTIKTNFEIVHHGNK